MTDTITLPRSVVSGALHALDLSQGLLASARSIHHITVLEEYKSLRATLSQQAEQGWQPIETAPNDGTIVLLHGGRFTTAGSYQPDDKNHPWVFLDDAELDRVNHWQANGPTYWMPLPEFKEIK